MRPVRCRETSVRNYFYSLRNNPEYRSSRLLRGGSQKYRKFSHILDIPIFILISSRKTKMGKTNGNGIYQKEVTMIPTPRTTFSNNLNSSVRC
jgi:hypothetical protein